MEIIKYGDENNKRIILIHGFESPYQIWEDYIEHYRKSYCVIVPIMPGHNVNMKDDFISFEQCAKELEDYCIDQFGSEIYAVYGMSMGGVLASHLWKNKRLKIRKLIMESSPLLSYGSFMTSFLTKQYLNITHKAQKGDKNVIKKAVGSMVTEDKLNCFIELLKNISDTTIKNYIKEIGKFKLPHNIDTQDTELFYFYGSNASEFLFRREAKFIRKNYAGATIFFLKGKGHCEDALLHPEKRIAELDKIMHE